jgi:hypothetical protein
VLNVFNCIQWCFNRLTSAQPCRSGSFVNPRMATLTRGSAQIILTSLSHQRPRVRVPLIPPFLLSTCKNDCSLQTSENVYGGAAAFFIFLLSLLQDHSDQLALSCSLCRHHGLGIHVHGVPIAPRRSGCLGMLPSQTAEERPGATFKTGESPGRQREKRPLGRISGSRESTLAPYSPQRFKRYDHAHGERNSPLDHSGLGRRPCCARCCQLVVLSQHSRANCSQSAPRAGP